MSPQDSVGPLFEALPGILAGLAGILGVALVAALVVARFPPSDTGPRSLLGATWALATLGGLVVLGQGLLLLGAFHPLATAGLPWLLAALLWRPWGASLRERWKGRGDGMADLVALARMPEAAVAAVAVAVALVRLGVAAGRPPLAWDALFYHLYRAGLWVQSQGFVVLDVPDAWRYTAWLPPGGDVIQAWGMVGHRTSLGVAPLSVAGCLLLPLALFAAARVLGASPRLALRASLLVGLVAAATSLLTAAYVDVPLAACAVLAVACLALPPSPASLAWAVFAAAVGASLKVSLLPMAAGVTLFALWRSRRAGGRLVLLTTLAALPLLPMVRTALLEGNPLHPMEVGLWGHTLLEGDPVYSLVNRGAFSDPVVEAFPGATLLHSLFVRWRPSMPGAPSGYGPGGALLLALGALGLVRMGHTHPRAARWVLFLASTWVLGALGPEMALYKGAFADQAGRLWLPVWACVGLGLVAAPPRPAAWLALVLLPWNLVNLASPLWLSPWPEGGTGGRWSRALAHPDGQVPPWDYHALARNLVKDAPLWDALDSPFPKRVAFAPSWSGMGQSYLYPLLGSTLQNTVIYVPPTRDGEVIPLFQAPWLAELADERSWLSRLHASGAGWVVTSRPPPLERAWIDARPQVFTPVAWGWPSGDARGGLFRVDREALARLLARQEAQ